MKEEYVHLHGSACTTGSLEPSHVLTSIGLNKDMTEGALRVSFSEENTMEDVGYLIENLVDIVDKIRKK